MRSKKRAFGDIGEEIAVEYLLGRNHLIVDRNYTKTFGEIDIVSQEETKLHFIEVKTSKWDLGVSYETEDGYRPEDNVHSKKVKRMTRTINTYLAERHYEGDWQVDALIILLDMRGKRVKVSYIENII